MPRPWIFALIVSTAACDGGAEEKGPTTLTTAASTPSNSVSIRGVESSTGADVALDWQFPGLISTPMGMTFPTYLAHLFGKRPQHPLAVEAVCVAVDNHGATTLKARLRIAFPLYGQPSEQDLAVAAGQRATTCLNPTFDFTALYALRETTPGRMEASLVDLASGRELGAAMRDFSIVAHNEIAWSASGISVGEMDDLSAVFVTPKDPAIDELQRQAQEHSAWKGFGGGDAYRRGALVSHYTIEPGSFVSEAVVLEPGESLSWRLLSVSKGGDEVDLDVYLFTPGQFEDWRGGAVRGAVAAWSDQRRGDGGTTEPAAGSYQLVLSRRGGWHDELKVAFTRNSTREDVARDVLRAVYTSLQDEETRYSNIPATYFAGWQHIRRPREVLAAHSANCIDGSLVFASVLELIGMEPVLLFTADHAYVGVRSAPGSPVIWPVETTLIDTAPFADAYRVGISELTADSASNPHFHPVDIRTLRAHRVLPLPQ